MTGQDAAQGDSGTLELGFSEAAGRASTDAPAEGVRVPTPAPVPTSDLSDEDRAVLDVIRGHRGRARAIGLETVAYIAGVNERTVQDSIARLIEQHQMPIGSAVKKPMGYYLIETEEELAESLSQLTHRITALARRIAALKQSTTPIVLKQMALELEQEAA